MTAAGSGPGHERAALDAVRLRLVNRWQAETLREDLADLYVESSDTATGETYRRREDFLHRLADSVRHPGFSMLLAETAALTGCAYGFPIARDGAWWLGFEGELGASWSNDSPRVVDEQELDTIIGGRSPGVLAVLVNAVTL